MFLPALVCLSVCVCLSVTTITKRIVDGFVQNFMARFLGEREDDQVRVSLRSIEGCGSNCQKNSAIAFVGSCTLTEYFPSSCCCILMSRWSDCR